MYILDKWLELNGKEPFFEEFMNTKKSTGQKPEIKLVELNQEYIKVLLPFIFGKYRLIEDDINYINSVFREMYQLKSFYRLYKELYLNPNINIVPVISLWNNVKKEQYIALALRGDIRLIALEIPIDRCNNNLFIELFIKNYLQIFNSFGELNLSYNENIIEKETSIINIIDSSTTSGYINTISFIKGMSVGKYISTPESVLILMGNKIKYWDFYNGNKDIDLNNIQMISNLLTRTDIISEDKNKTPLLKIKQKYFLNSLKEIQKNI